ncbi:predicted protein [Nematostella vectensis]|uniref:Vesicular, overexpressed in cancer, prosurvival protein 1 n=2 Tax=Nematostella vectensis TaxID=45351 RepID=A7S427_NEMVE|nr:predicted protein [Nematostella vectensis]|eukprot:XP_001633593.1 predicted protein [Nematostella vectensis]
MGYVLYAKAIILLAASNFLQTKADDYCGRKGKKEFYCDKGHCCGNFECCVYYKYYEMWWFWLIWCVITILGCSCAYLKRRQIGLYGYTMNVQNNLQSRASSNSPEYPKHKLPSYAEVIAMPNLGPPDDIEGAPPPYFVSLPSASTGLLGSTSSLSTASQSEATTIDIVPDINYCEQVKQDCCTRTKNKGGT